MAHLVPYIYPSIKTVEKYGIIANMLENIAKEIYFIQKYVIESLICKCIRK